MGVCTLLFLVDMAIDNAWHSEAIHFPQDGAMEINPCSNMPRGENEAWSCNTPQADLEGIFLSPLKQGALSSFNSKQSRMPTKCL